MFTTVVAYIAFGCVMVAIAVSDVRTLQIANRSELLLVGLWALWRIALGAEDYVTDLKTSRSPGGIELLFGRSMILLAARAAGKVVAE